MEVTTTNLADFRGRELRMAEELLHQLNCGNLPDEFLRDEVTIMFNVQSGYVFLTNSDFQVAMMNGDKLEMWYNCPECGTEGFQEDIDFNPEQYRCKDCCEVSCVFCGKTNLTYDHPAKDELCLDCGRWQHGTE